MDQMFEQSYAKISKDLENFKFAKSQALIGLLPKATSLTESSYESTKKLRDQRASLSDLVGKPTRQALEVARQYKNVQDLVAESSVLASRTAEGRLGGLIPEMDKLMDKFFEKSDQSAQEAHEILRRLQAHAEKGIEQIPAIDALTLALAVASNDYLYYQLALQIYDQRDSEFEQTLRKEGIWSVLNLIIGSVPYIGLPASFVETIGGLLKQRVKRVKDADELLLFLETYTKLLEAWLPQADAQLQQGVKLIEARRNVST